MKFLRRLTEPSFKAGYAQSPSESAHPNLWDGLAGAWMPSLGVTGDTLRDVSGNRNDGTLTNMDAASDWVATSKGLALDMLSPDDSINAGFMSDFSDELTINIVEKTNNNGDGIRISVGSTTAANFGFQNISSDSLRLFCRPASQSYVVVDSATGIRDTSSFSTYSVVFNRGAVTFFKNGKKYSQHTFGLSALPPSTNELTIGAFAGYNIGGTYQRQFTSLHLYNRALRPDEIQTLYVDSLAPFRKKQQIAFNAHPLTLLEKIRSASKPTTPISIMVKHNEEPSYKAGYAKNAGESENPDLWDGLTGAWVPNLGIGSGLKIKNLAVKNDEGDLKNDIEWSQKGMIQNDADQYVLLPDGYVNTEGTVIGSIDPIGVYSYWRSSIVWSSRNWVVEIKMEGNGSFIASCYKWGGSGFVLVNSSLIQRDKSYTLASSFKDGDTLKLYVDGNLAGEAAYTGANQTQAGWSARIFSYSDPQPGQHNWANPYLYGPVLLYKRVLSASEIKTLSEDLLAPFRRKKSPIGYQPIKEVKGLIRT